MPYNITANRLKFEKFIIPISNLYVGVISTNRIDWVPVRTDYPDNTTVFSVMDTYIKGVVDKSGRLHVTDMDLSGEGSGTAWEWVWEPAISGSFGIFKGMFVWECGKKIERFMYENGELKFNKEEI